jgi:FAD/FMN-containing dehydrogenase/Fe-S oxidoreductase
MANVLTDRSRTVAGEPADRLVTDATSRGLGHLLDRSRLSRAMYSADASLYRVVPELIAQPETAQQLADIVSLANRHQVPITTRGAGTSIAGNAVGPGLILNTTRHLNKIISIDPQARTATVEPGVVHAALQQEALKAGLRFGPDPSSHSRCTIGGMIGNNACGSRAMAYGRTVDNLVAVDLVTADGQQLHIDADTKPEDVAMLSRLADLVSGQLATIRTQFGQFGRQVSGYCMEHLLPERGFDVRKFLAGTEGTCGVITRATVRLVADAPVKQMVALGYPGMAEAADAVPTILEFGPTACEGLGSRIVDVVRRRRGANTVPALPRGQGWLLVELTGDDAAEVRSRADRLLTDAGCTDGFVVDDPDQAAALWKIREDGAGLATISMPRPAHAGWEDSAVPPHRLGAYLRELEALMAEHRVNGLPYGHFGDGCIHIRIDFPLWESGGSRRYRDFIEAAAKLAAGFGGSMSGEHGDGRARSELLATMYPPEVIDLFGAVKHIFDPKNLLNPGVLTQPRPFDADLRIPQARDRRLALTAPQLTREVHRCTGVGKCLANNTPGHGVMCPSYQATGNEKDSTRGRARTLQEMINGDLIGGGFSSPQVHEALDLCLSCKGCRQDCPTGVDMAAYKAEVLDRSYAGKLRPRTHYTLGWLPRWGRMITATAQTARLANAGMRLPGLSRLIKYAAGIDSRKRLPAFDPQRPGRHRRLPAITPDTPTEANPVIIWTDSLSDQFAGNGIDAAARVLEQAGYRPYLLPRTACCGITWITTGQLEGARRQLRHALDVLTPYAQAGIPIVGLEPSCLAVWRSDAPELLDDHRVAPVADSINTLAELLTATQGWQPPDLTGTELVVQPHCHHASVIGWQADAALLNQTGATITTVGGCCGLAGNFGMERGHYKVGVQVAEHDLLPAVRNASPDALVLADGFSCRTQLAELSDRRAITLADLLARAGDHPRSSRPGVAGT